MDQISPGMFWTGPNMTKYQGPFGVDQMSNGHFGQKQMVLQMSRTFWHEPKISYGSNILQMFWTGPSVC